jgi:hypothetical protein
LNLKAKLESSSSHYRFRRVYPTRRFECGFHRVNLQHPTIV